MTQGIKDKVAVISGGEIVKYAALWALSHQEHLRFGRDDLTLTFLFAASALVMGELVKWVGLPGGSIYSALTHASGF